MTRAEKVALMLRKEQHDQLHRAERRIMMKYYGKAIEQPDQCVEKTMF